MTRYREGMSTVHSFPSARTLNDRVVQEVNALRGRYQINQSALADVIGVPQSQMSRRLRGLVPFSLAEIEALAGFFAVPVSSLLGMSEPHRPRGPRGGNSAGPTSGGSKSPRWMSAHHTLTLAA